MTPDATNWRLGSVTHGTIGNVPFVQTTTCRASSKPRRFAFACSHQAVSTRYRTWVTVYSSVTPSSIGASCFARGTGERFCSFAMT